MSGSLTSVSVEFDEVVASNGLERGLEEEDARRVAEPRVEYAIGLVVEIAAVEVAADLHLLGKGHDVGRVGQVEVLVRPQLAGGAQARLHLVDEEQAILAAGNRLQALKEVRTRVVVAAL